MTGLKYDSKRPLFCQPAASEFLDRLTVESHARETDGRSNLGAIALDEE